MTKSVRKIGVIAVAIGIVAIAVLASVVYFSFLPKKGKDRIFVKVYEWNQKSIEVSAFPQVPGYSPGIYYDFNVVGPDGRRELILTFRNDDPLEIDGKTVRYLSEDVAYIHVGWKYAVTLNAGKDWKIWDAETGLADWQCCQISIGSVDVQQSGIGKMVLNDKNNAPSYVFVTSNYGQTWTLDQ